MDILSVRDRDDAEEDLGFGTIRFNVRKGHGYTSLSVEAFVFKGTIGSYKLELDSSPEAGACLNFSSDLTNRTTEPAYHAFPFHVQSARQSRHS